MNTFIKQLIKEKKIKITEPSNEMAESYIKKSHKSLISSKIVQKVENYDDAIALTYYSMYYSALALLYKCGIKSENHTGTIIILKEIFDNKKKNRCNERRTKKTIQRKTRKRIFLKSLF